MEKAKWMWQYGEFEIYHNMMVHSRRQEFGVDYPAMWRVEAPAPWAEFEIKFTAEKPGYLKLFVNGMGYVEIGGKKYRPGIKVDIKTGSYTAWIRVMNTSGLPCAYVESDVCPSGEKWYTHFAAPKWGEKAEKLPAGCVPEYFDVNVTPENFPFSYKRLDFVSKKEVCDGVLFDFGRESFGKLCLENCKNQELGVFYGESEEEATDTENTLIFETIKGEDSYILRSRAFRYIFIKGEDLARLKVHCELEYLPLEDRGSFSCNDSLMNDIWRISKDTFHLNSREFYLDGIKRDRWVWSGDAFQSYMLNNYLYFDKEITRRTIIALRGRDSLVQHLNKIPDYSFYWIISVMNYYNNYGDKDFLRFIYPKMQSLMEFCETRINNDGFFEGAEGDWIFIDWSNIDKTGAISAEQILFYAAYKAMAEAAEIVGKPCDEYRKKADKLYKIINEYYWSEEKGAFIDSYSSGKNNVTRHANIFAIMFDFATDEQKQSIIGNVLLNDEITQITTPYFKFFEMDVMCKIGRIDYVTGVIRDYWGGMVGLGATSIWEEYVPGMSGTEHYAMYESKYGKSLCHAWGAGPIYLLGRYCLGVYPTDVAYKTFNVEPNLGDLKQIRGTVPVNGGTVFVQADENGVCVKSDVSGGTLIWNNKKYEIPVDKEIKIGAYGAYC